VAPGEPLVVVLFTPSNLLKSAWRKRRRAQNEKGKEVRERETFASA
jgi:hypothetical protein